MESFGTQAYYLCLTIISIFAFIFFRNLVLRNLESNDEERQDNVRPLTRQKSDERNDEQ